MSAQQVDLPRQADEGADDDDSHFWSSKLWCKQRITVPTSPSTRTCPARVSVTGIVPVVVVPGCKRSKRCTVHIAERRIAARQVDPVRVPDHRDPPDPQGVDRLRHEIDAVVPDSPAVHDERPVAVTDVRARICHGERPVAVVVLHGVHEEEP